MKLKVLFSDKYKIAAVCSGDDCAVKTDLSGENLKLINYQTTLDYLNNMLRIAAINGLSKFGSNYVHLVDRKNKIYEFSKGDLRLIFFNGEGTLVAICINIFVKKSQKTPKEHVKNAVLIKNKYFEEAKSNQILEEYGD